jgi:hypothetical protein
MKGRGYVSGKTPAQSFSLCSQFFSICSQACLILSDLGGRAKQDAGTEQFSVQNGLFFWEVAGRSIEILHLLVTNLFGVEDCRNIVFPAR